MKYMQVYAFLVILMTNFKSKEKKDRKSPTDTAITILANLLYRHQNNIQYLKKYSESVI